MEVWLPVRDIFFTNSNDPPLESPVIADDGILVKFAPDPVKVVALQSPFTVAPVL